MTNPDLVRKGRPFSWYPWPYEPGDPVRWCRERNVVLVPGEDACRAALRQRKHLAYVAASLTDSDVVTIGAGPSIASVLDYIRGEGLVPLVLHAGGTREERRLHSRFRSQRVQESKKVFRVEGPVREWINAF